MGVELPSPDSEEFGGFVYEMCYLGFRIRPEPHLLGEEVDQFFEEHFTPKRKRLEEILEPSYGDYLAYRRAIDMFHEYERYGKPCEGGYREQSAEWILIMRTVTTARERAESLSNREDARYNKDKASNAQGQSPS